MRLSLNQITLSAFDMAESMAFYQKLGLTLIVDSAPRYVRFEFPEDENGHADTLSLHAAPEGWEAQNGDPLIYFEVEDVAKFLAHCGISPEATPEAKSYLWTEADILDPSGNRIRIFNAGQNRRFPPWRV